METIKKHLPKLGTVGTAFLVSPTLAFLAWMCYKLRDATIFYLILSGRFFTEQWDMTDPHNQPELGKAYIILAGVAVILLPYLALLRTISARKTRFEYWIFAIPTALACLFLFSISTVLICVSIKWIQVEGNGMPVLLVGIAGYIVVLGFLIWAIWPPKRNEKME